MKKKTKKSKIDALDLTNRALGALGAGEINIAMRPRRSRHGYNIDIESLIDPFVNPPRILGVDIAARVGDTCTVTNTSDEPQSMTLEMLNNGIAAMRDTFLRETMEDRMAHEALQRETRAYRGEMSATEIRERYREYFGQVPEWMNAREREMQARDRFDSPLPDPRRLAPRVTDREDPYQSGRIFRIAMPRIDMDHRIGPHANPVDETMDVVEFRVRGENTAPELIHAGWMRGANPSIIENVNRVLHHMISSRDGGPMFRRDREFLPNNARNFLEQVRTAMTRQYGALNAMAEDKCWPLFWYNIARQNQPSEYNRDTAGLVIDGFKRDHDLSNSDWKFLCGKGAAYLYHLFEGAPPYNIRWPDVSFIRSWREIPGRSEKKPLAEFLRRVSRDDPAFQTLNPRDFGYIMRDYFDIAGARGGASLQEAIEKILRSKTWAEFAQRLHDNEARAQSHHQRMMEQMIRMHSNAMNHFDFGHLERDMMRYMHASMFGSETVKPKKTTPFEWMSFLPNMIDGKSFKAIILHDDVALYAEGQEKMQHCIFRLYKTKIEKAEYIGIHIVADHLDKDGYTLGLARMLGEGQSNRLVFKVDQIRAKRNGTSQDKKLHSFGEVVCRKINELCEQRIKEIDDAKK